jgi:hypothetical protein
MQRRDLIRHHPHGLLARVYLAQSRLQDALAEAKKENHLV